MSCFYSEMVLGKQHSQQKVAVVDSFNLLSTSLLEWDLLWRVMSNSGRLLTLYLLRRSAPFLFLAYVLL